MEIKINIETLRNNKLMLCTPMYGGQCAGMFTKSVADLSAFCSKHGIPLQLYFLFNESLITRARNYCADTFMCSDAQHLMFIDSDIGFNPQDVIALMALQAQDEKYDIIGGPYAKKCLHHSAKILTEDGFKTVSWVVNNKYSGNVVSFDDKGNKVLSKVTNHWVEPNKNKKWVSIRTSNVRSRDLLTVTSDHEVAYVENVFEPEIKFIAAEYLVGKHMVVNPTKNSNRRFNALFNKQQLSALVGTSLGDGCLSNESLVCRHGPKQVDYVKHKSDLFNANLSKNKLSFTIKNDQTKKLSKLIGYGKTKTLKNVIEMIDEISLAYMYMDDGNLYDYTVRAEENGYDNWWVNLDNGHVKRSAFRPSGENWIVGRKQNLREPTCSIATMSFSVEDNNKLIQHIKSKYDIDAKLMFQSPNKYGNKYPFISFDSINTNKFHKLIKSFVHPSMEYKLIEMYRGCEKTSIDNKPLDYGTIVVDHIVQPNDKNNSYLYDIEVENTHNFVANDVLVHNCISWEKVKKAVDKGVADEDPNVLEKFGGDFVFNPKEGRQSIPINEPVEVLEIGTGFMMISKKAMQKFADSYPQYLYKPDHVRTANFDGSREIMQYFQAEIDPKTKRYLSEDYFYCQKSQEIGLKTWLCPWMKLQHVGTYIFGGSLADLASIGASATANPEELKKKK